MLAIQIDAPGAISSLTVRHVSEPSPDANEVKIEMIACSINPADVKIRTGAVVPLVGGYPFTLGYDLVGTVVETGSEVSDLPLGARVLAMSAAALTGRGTWSERVCLSRSSVAQLPAGMDPVAAARLPLVGLTAYQAVKRADPAPGTDVLIAGSVGSVGRMVVRLLLARGVRVHGLVRRPEQADQLPRHGLLITHVGQAPPSSVDFVIDAAGGDFSSALAPGGLYLSLVPDRAPSPEALAVRALRRTVLVTRESGADLEDLAVSGLLAVETPRTFSMKDVHAAHEEFEHHGQRNVVLVNDNW